MAQENLSELVKRLENVATRLESITVKPQSNRLNK